MSARFAPDEPDSATEAERVDVCKRLAAALGQPTASKAYACIAFGMSTLVMNGVHPVWLAAKIVERMERILSSKHDLRGFNEDGRVVFFRPGDKT